MKLYEINAELQRLQDRVEWQEDEKCFLDLDTGEILDDDELDAIFMDLQMERADRIEWMCRMRQNDKAEAEAIKREVQRLQSRQKQYERRADYFEKLILSQCPKAEDFGVFSVKYTTTHPLEYEPRDEMAIIEWLENNGHDSCVKYALPELRKDDIKKLIKSGVKVPKCKIADKQKGRVV